MGLMRVPAKSWLSRSPVRILAPLESASLMRVLFLVPPAGVIRTGQGSSGLKI